MDFLENIKQDIDNESLNSTMLELSNNTDSSVSQMFGRALKDDSLIGIVIDEVSQFANDFQVEEDETFNDAKKDILLEQYGDTIHEDFRDDVKSRAKNFDHFKQLVAEYQHQTKLENDLDDSGILGFGLRFGSEITNIPAYIAPQLLLPKVALALNSGMLGRAGYGAVEGVVYEYAKETLGDTEKDTIDYTLSAGLGALVGAKFGNLSSDVLDIARNDVKSKFRITNDVEQKLISAETKEAKDKVLQEHFKKHNIGKQSDYEDELLWIQKRAEDGTFNSGVASKLRADLKHLTSKSPSDIMQEFSRQHFKDSTLQGNKTNLRTMNEEAIAIEDRLIESSNELFNPLVKDFAENVYGKNWLTARWSDARVVVSNIAGTMQMQRNLYGDTVPKEDILASGIQMLKQYGATDEYAVQLANKLYKASGETATRSHDILSAYGKKGFEAGEIEKNENYMPIVYNRNMDEVLANKGLGLKELNDFVSNSLLSKTRQKFTNPDGSVVRELGQEDIDAVKEIANVLTQAIYHAQTAVTMQGNSFDDIIKGIFKENKDRLLSINPKLGEFLFQETSDATKRTGVSSRARSPFDYSYTQRFTNNKGEEVELSFMDLVNKNMLGNHIQYSRKMGGAVALEKTKFNFPEEKSIFDGITDDSFEYTKQLKEDIKTFNKQRDEFIKDIDSISGDTISYNKIDRLGKKYGINIDSKTFFSEKDSVKKREMLDSIADTIRKNIDESIGNINKSLDDIKNRFPEGTEESIINSFNDLVKENSDLFKRISANAHKVANETSGDYNQIYKDMVDDSKELIDNINNKFKELTTIKTNKELTLGTEAERLEIKNRISREMTEKGVDTKKAKAELVRFDEIVDDYLGKPTSTDPFGTLTQMQRIASNLNIARLLGQTGITMSAELGGLMFRAGVRNFMEFSSMKSLMKQLKTGKIDDKLAQEIQTHIGLGTALTRDINPNAYDHEFDLQGLGQVGIRDRILDSIENTSAKLADATLMIGGVKPLTANGEIIISKTVINEIVNIAGKGKKTLTKTDIKNLNEYGIDEVMAQRIHSQIKEHGSFSKKKWSNGHKVQELGYENWTDAEAQKFLTNSVRRISNNIIQKSLLGDKVGNVVGEKLFKNNLFGKLFLELKDYVITSYVAQLGRTLTRRDAHMFGMFMAQASALTVATVGQNYMNNAYNEEKLKESMKPENILKRVVSLMPPSAYIPTAVDMASNVFTGERFFSPSRHQSEAQNILMSFPTIDLAVKSEGLIRETGKSLYNFEPTDALIRNGFGVAPLGNTYGVRTLKEGLLSD